MVNHYDATFALGLSAQDKAALVEYLKIVAMRRSFEDQALASRFLTEEMGQRSRCVSIAGMASKIV